MERLAGNTYRAAAERFSGDQVFSDFLTGLAEDEDSHYKLIKDAGKKLMDKKDNTLLPLKIDRYIREKVEAPLMDLYDLITSSHRVNKQAIMKTIVNVEFAELNNIFLYILNTLRDEEDDIKEVAETVQLHENRIKDFLSVHFNNLDFSDLIKRLSPGKGKKILVLDDNMPTLMFVAKMVEGIGDVETVSNGREGLKKINHGFYNVIISDIDMPSMDGIQFFRNPRAGLAS